MEDYQEKLRELIKYSLLGYNRCLTIADSGNVSCRYGESVLITASGLSLGETAEDNILQVDMDGNILANPSGLKPSKEMLMHLSIYKIRPQIQSVYHVHPVYVTAYAVKGMEIPLLTSTSKRKIIATPFVPYATPGSEELSRLVSEKIAHADEKINAFILQDHGLITLGKSLESSFQLAELVEATAKVAVLAKFV